jgi:hypothetical protein
MTVTPSMDKISGTAKNLEAAPVPRSQLGVRLEPWLPLDHVMILRSWKRHRLPIMRRPKAPAA